MLFQALGHHALIFSSSEICLFVCRRVVSLLFVVGSGWVHVCPLAGGEKRGGECRTDYGRPELEDKRSLCRKLRLDVRGEMASSNIV